MTSATLLERSAGLKAMSSGLNSRQTLITLLVSLAYVSSRCWKTGFAARGTAASGIAVYSYCIGITASLLRLCARAPGQGHSRSRLDDGRRHQAGENKSHQNGERVSQGVVGGKSVPVPVRDVGADRRQNSRGRNEPPASPEACEAGLAQQKHLQQQLQDIGTELNQDRTHKAEISCRMVHQNSRRASGYLLRTLLHGLALLSPACIRRKSCARKDVQSSFRDAGLHRSENRLLVGNLPDPCLAQRQHHMRHERPHPKSQSAKDAS